MKKTSNNLLKAVKLVKSVKNTSSTFGEFKNKVHSSEKIIALTTKWTREQLIQKHALAFEN